ncbi:Hypothetical leucine rich repeat protein-likely pseudogene [Ectocarpus siliculosus]|nr:Hypothetical leucine rich repeat protein-likely pseudogene [Ectocarpus siliculosus]|eukprot:CBJ29659.1 Hypothetical leucine rich repeat protein-likely pseudogene [Ectocarpus siliculosus]
MAATDRDALVAVFHSTGGRSWAINNNWNTMAELFRWYGIKVDGRGRVVKLKFRSIPMELGTLTMISSLYLGWNKITGSIPEELGALTNLKHLLLGHNQLTGSIPKELGALTNLRSLGLDHNELTGAIPKELGTLTRMASLSLRGNNVTGPRS